MLKFFQDYQGEVDPQVGHKSTGADNGAQVMQLTQVQLAHIVSGILSHALT